MNARVVIAADRVRTAIFAMTSDAAWRERSSDDKARALAVELAQAVSELNAAVSAHGHVAEDNE